VSLPPRIAVVIPCRDDASFLDACLRALAAQTRLPDEIIVVDNASSDDSAAVALSHGARVVDESRIGIWPAAARGYDEAMGADIIARLDADSRPHPDWVSRVVQAFVADAGLGVLTGGAEFYGASPLVHYLGARWYIGGGTYWVNRWLGIPLVFGSNFAMRSDVWARVRLRVDRANPRIHDDLDLTIHLRESDGVRYDPELRMPVSSRPFAAPSALWRRVWRVVPTFAASWPEGSPWHRAREAARPIDATEIAWPPDADDLAPEYGR
jgi:glycosyltransferase involved in cell wall biosynthesis